MPGFHPLLAPTMWSVAETVVAMRKSKAAMTIEADMDMVWFGLV